ncbi:hypothetical protein [Halomonas sp. PA16-9]
MSNQRFDGPRFQDRVMVVTGAAQGSGLLSAPPLKVRAWYW